MKRWIIIFGAITVVIFVLGGLFRQQITNWFAPPIEPTSKTPVKPTEQVQTTPSTVVDQLATPWSISFLPDGDMLVTQREGKLTRVGKQGKTIEVSGVYEIGEGGLLGLALDPEMSNNRFIYLYYTANEGGKLTNRIDRYVFRDNTLSQRTTILSDIPAARNHNGGAIAFGPDNKLYVTTGDAAQPELAQDRNSLAGKILRVNADGSRPSDNPFDNLVWSYGHRNPQGIAWDSHKRMWSVEHGPSGLQSGNDELNRITRGGNYGWPTIVGDQTKEGMITPIVESGGDDTWAPSGMAYLNGSLYFAGLRGQTLYKATIDASGDSVNLEKLFAADYGRLRAVTAHDGAIYFSTSNRDGNGDPRSNDDRIVSLRLIAK